jgi:hypothetical protein
LPQLCFVIATFIATTLLQHHCSCFDVIIPWYYDGVLTSLLPLLSHCSIIITPCYCYSLCWYFCTIYYCWNLGVVGTICDLSGFFIIFFLFVSLSLICKFCCCVSLMNLFSLLFVVFMCFVCTFVIWCSFVSLCFVLILVRMFVYIIIKCKIYNTHFGHLHMKLTLHFTFTHKFCTMIKGGKIEWFFNYFHTLQGICK